MMRPRRRAAAAVAGAVALLVNTACYSYLPPPGGTLEPGRDARVELTTEGSATLQAAVGPRIRVIEGRVRNADADGNATVDVEQLTSWDGVAADYAGRDPVRIPRSAIARAGIRTLDRQRSWVAAGVIGGVFAIAVVTALAKARSRASGSQGRIGGSAPDIRSP